METIKLFVKNGKNENLACEINMPEKPSGNPSVLILHALTGKKENRTINFLAKNLPKYGWNTIQFDFSGHGESEGKLEEATVSKQLGDIRSVLSGINKENVVIIGNSFSVVTALAFARENDVSALILLSGRANYLKYMDTLDKLGGKYRLSDDVLIDEKFIEDYKKHDPLENIAAIKKPTLIIHGENDEIIPKTDAELICKSSAAEKKEIAIIPYADHRYSGQNCKEAVLSRIISFLEKITLSRQ